ncbi:DUF2062 domain-containing protein [Crenobacter intestini]|uniref:DUF2062 domain-containing protein n=1 Tax=Crenobacter intestini TaxID=2563443 RepID=A0A4T0UXC3_9NEIS|nr:DUF2062 domain-containing protein [Crenobacter intestini]TIC83638.1 DUF2062 domain-containing protein [Crenobacter intestini]
MKKTLRRWLPDAKTVRENRSLRWLAPFLGRDELWYLSRRGVALGMAVGVFFGLLTPFAQILFAVAVSILLRANVAAAALSTLVTNPVTFAPVYWLAYRVGQWLLGGSGAPPADHSSLLADLTGVGKPLLVGLVLFAFTVSPLVYFGVNGLWRASSAWAWRRRSRRRARAAGA